VERDDEERARPAAASGRRAFMPPPSAGKALPRQTGGQAGGSLIDMGEEDPGDNRFERY
jgi:hypothetical protein